MRTTSSISIVLLATALLTCAGCTSMPEIHTVPITGRRTILHIAEPQEISMGLSAYEEATSKVPQSQNKHYIDMVTRVGKRIAEVADRPDYDWEFRVLASPEQNAFCLPGGKVAIHEGILPVCQSESGLAVVMAHEIAHALARHGGERVRNSEITEQAKSYVGSMLQKQEPVTQEMVMKAYGLGTEYGFLMPYSRKHESEADHMGLVLMAKAGYDPAEAPRFWERFATIKQGQKTPEFLSTHPSDERRAADLLELLPKAQTEYLAATEKLGRGEMLVISQIPAATPTTPAANLAQAPAGTNNSTFQAVGTGAATQPPVTLPSYQLPGTNTNSQGLFNPIAPTAGATSPPPSRSYQ